MDITIEPYYEVIDAESIEFDLIPRNNFFSKQLYSLDTEFIYWWKGQVPIHCLKSSDSGVYYDLFSVPPFVQALTRRNLTNVMPGFECTFVHDDVCRLEIGTRKDRRLIFVESYSIAMQQFYPGHEPDAWSEIIKEGVVAGSKWFGQC